MFVRVKLGAQKSASTAVADPTFRHGAESAEGEGKLLGANAALAPLAAAPEAAALQTAARQTPVRQTLATQTPAPQTPRIKTYRVAEVRQAMSAARRDLGDDAILIQTKRLDSSEDGSKYEVTFGVVGDAVLPPAPAPPARIEKAPPQPRVEIPASSPQIVSANTAWAVEFERLRMDLASLHAIVSKGFSKTDAADPGVQLHGQLVQHGIDADLAAEWVKAVEPAARAGSWTRPAVRDALVEQLSSRVRVDASLGWDSTQDKAIMLVGPAGSGKTTALLKLALEFGVKRGRDVELWTLDNQSGDVDPMVQSFARLLNLPSRQFRSARTLAASFEGVSSGKSLVLVDTTGSWGTSVDGDQELSQVLGSASRIDCQLVLPAAWQPSAVAKAVDRFEVFQPSRLLFSMLDHTCVWGAMLQEPWRTSKALSFLGEGAMGSGSMQASSVARILDRIFEPAE